LLGNIQNGSSVTFDFAGGEYVFSTVI